MFTRQEIDEYLKLLYSNGDEWSANVIAQLLRQLDEKDARIARLTKQLETLHSGEIKSDWFYNPPSLEG